MEQRLNELIFLLATISLVSWTAVGATTLVRAAARLRYTRRARTRLQQQPEEAVD